VSPSYDEDSDDDEPLVSVFPRHRPRLATSLPPNTPSNDDLPINPADQPTLDLDTNGQIVRADVLAYTVLQSMIDEGRPTEPDEDEDDDTFRERQDAFDAALGEMQHLRFVSSRSHSLYVLIRRLGSCTSSTART
jgi:hypothetical protein